MKISEERWRTAQQHEYEWHVNDPDPNVKNSYQRSYGIIFKYFNISKDSLKEKTILEIGPAFYPALLDIDVKEAYVIEPMYNNFPQEIKTLYKEKNIKILECIGEDLDKLNLKFDEIWIFNLLQHVKDPEKILNNSYNFSKITRIFEPINLPTDICHPHSFNFNFFKDLFPNTDFKIHKGGSIEKFHGADCIYGSIENEK